MSYRSICPIITYCYKLDASAPIGASTNKVGIVPMSISQLKLLSRMIRDGQAKLIESNGKLIPVSLI
jgi:hypothetical protein